MTWWLRTRTRAWPLLWHLVAVLAVLGVRDSALPVPRVVPGEAPAVLLLPAVAAAAVVTITGRSGSVHEERSPRRIAVYDLTFAAALIAAAALVWLIAAWLGVPGDWLGAIRNLVGYAGVAHLAARWDLTAGAVAPCVVGIVTAVLGRPDQLWAWPLAVGASMPAAGAAIVLAIGGVAARVASLPR